MHYDTRNTAQLPPIELDEAGEQASKPPKIRVERPHAPDFQLKILPDNFQSYASDCARRIGCPIEYIAIPLMVAAGGLIGNGAKIQPKRYDDGFTVTPNLWGAIVGNPGTRKSAGLDAGTFIFRELESEAYEKYQQEKTRHEQDKSMAELEYANAKDTIKNKIKQGETADPNDLRQAVLAEPEARRYCVNNATPEKLGEILSQNPKGITNIQDELSGLLSDMNKSDKQTDRAFYLAAWNGNGSYTYDRIKRGTVHIAQATLSIIGGIQPDKLAPYLNSIQGAGDGFFQRFQPMVYPNKKLGAPVDAAPDKKAKALVAERLRACTGYENAIFRFDKEAQILFYELETDIHNRVNEGKLSPVKEALVSKYISLAPSLALIDHIIDNNQGEQVTESSMLKALQWVAILERHADRCYLPETTATVSANKIIDHWNELENGFTQSDLIQKKWGNLTKKAISESALKRLVTQGYLEPRKKETKGRHTTGYYKIWQSS